MGHNNLSKVVKNLCAAAEIEGYKTNHSLRATCATRLFENDVDEQLIMERTGHRSSQGVRSYKRTSHVHHHKMSVVIDNKSIEKQSTSTSNINFHFYEGCNVVLKERYKNQIFVVKLSNYELRMLKIMFSSMILLMEFMNLGTYEGKPLQLILSVLCEH